ncbi:MAG: substrate-binding domain-containing protein [Flavobacteriaceae bacterium]|jgi:phosphate transport system substrate-binding protein|nr:substrate-binding domain-containing protein [Flavobacteriaceae bacterium]
MEEKKAYRKGNLTIAIDPSFLNLGTALTEVFHSSYPEAKITFKPEVEDLAIADVVNGNIPMAITSRDLTKEEAKILFNKTRIKHIPVQIACDAAIFVTARESSVHEVSVSEMRTEILAPNSIFVFDGGNSSNFNTVMKKLNLPVTKEQKIKALSDAEEVIAFISKNKSHIGVIGMDVLSDEDDPKVKELTTKIKILPVVNDGEIAIEPSIPNLRKGKYPFTKRVYLLNAEGGFKIGSSFARFCGSQRGQLIVTKAGLQPYYLYKRRVEVH